MASSYSLDLRGRVIAFVNRGGVAPSCSAAFFGSDSFPIRLAKQVAASRRWRRGGKDGHPAAASSMRMRPS